MSFKNGEKLLYIYYTPYVVWLTPVTFEAYTKDYRGVVRCRVSEVCGYLDEGDLWSKEQILALFDGPAPKNRGAHEHWPDAAETIAQLRDSRPAPAQTCKYRIYREDVAACNHPDGRDGYCDDLCDAGECPLEASRDNRPAPEQPRPPERGEP